MLGSWRRDEAQLHAFEKQWPLGTRERLAYAILLYTGQRVGDAVRMQRVETGIADDSYVEIVEGLKEGQEVVSGGYKAISRELEDSKKIRKGKPEGDKEKEKK